MSESNEGQHIALPTVVLCVFAIGLAVVLTFGFNMEPGTAADWLAAAGTVVAVGAAVYAGVWAKRAYELELERERDRDEERRAEQARAVVAWVAAPEFEGTMVQNGRTKWGKLAKDATIMIQNSSGMPVWDVHVAVYLQRDHGKEWEKVGGCVLPISPPQDEAYAIRLCPDKWRSVYDEFRDMTNEYPSLQAAITFTDARGQRWMRKRAGLLVSVDEQGPDRTEG